MKLKFNHLSQPTIQFLVILNVAKYIADLQRFLFTFTHFVTAIDNHHGLEHCNRMIGSQPIIFKIVLSYLYSISLRGQVWGNVKQMFLQKRRSDLFPGIFDLSLSHPISFSFLKVVLFLLFEIMPRVKK